MHPQQNKHQLLRKKVPPDIISDFPVSTVVVLVQESRSFDHMLGWMKSLNPEIDGVTGSESNLLSTSDPNSTSITFAQNAAYGDPDPDNSEFGAIHEQVFGREWKLAWSADCVSNERKKPKKASRQPRSAESSGYENLRRPTMSGFAQNAEGFQEGMSTTVMSGFRPDAVPVYKELVAEFAVCDRWFAAVPASTLPNRLYVHSATSHGATCNDPEAEQFRAGFPQRTIFESLEEKGWSFGIYSRSLPSTLLYRNLRKLKYVQNFHKFDLEFKTACESGELPNYVVVEDYPSHDVAEGQRFVKEVYEALRSSPQWNEILFIIMYDEHGGFFDHVSTPVTGVPSPDRIEGPGPYNFQFNRLGVRVPVIMISPRIPRGTVLHGPSSGPSRPCPTSEFEHSSLPATVKNIFWLGQYEFLTTRDAWAGTFENVLSLCTPRTDCPDTLPEPVKPRELDLSNEEAKLTDFQEGLVQMAATLCGDHKKDIYPDKLVENMTVGKAVEYLNNVFKDFLETGKQAMENGADGDHNPYL